jgi:hypothetical protein
MARRGKAGHGAAWRGMVLFLKRIHFKHISIQILARHGWARRGMAGHGATWQGAAWQGEARRGFIFETDPL